MVGLGWLELMVIIKGFFFMNITKRLINLLVIFIVLFGCSKNESEPDSLPTQKTVIVYISANNDLKYSALKSIDQMETAYLPKFGNLLVYVKTDRYSSHILRIKSNNEIGIIKSDTLISYEFQNASDPDFMKKVFEDMMKISPSKEYGLILWSHGTAWLPKSGNIKTKSIGYDRGIETDISDLKYIIPDNISYIIFDACYMSSIEVIYELKDKANYIIASNSEILNTSFPYQKVVPYLFGELSDLKEICRQYYAFYNAKEGLERSCTISLVKTEELDNLAKESRSIIERKTNFEINRNAQDFNFVKGIPIEFFDYQDLFDKNFSKEESEKIALALNKCVLFKAATPNFLNNEIKEFSGLSISIPEAPQYQEFYKTLSWYKETKVNFF